MKRAGGQRFYRPRDIELLAAVRRLLHDEGLSIREVQQLSRAALLEGGESPSAPENAPTETSIDRLRAALSAALAAKTRLDALLNH